MTEYPQAFYSSAATRLSGAGRGLGIVAASPGLEPVFDGLVRSGQAAARLCGGQSQARVLPCLLYDDHPDLGFIYCGVSTAIDATDGRDTPLVQMLICGRQRPPQEYCFAYDFRLASQGLPPEAHPAPLELAPAAAPPVQREFPPQSLAGLLQTLTEALLNGGERQLVCWPGWDFPQTVAWLHSLLPPTLRCRCSCGAGENGAVAFHLLTQSRAGAIDLNQLPPLADSPDAPFYYGLATAYVRDDGSFAACLKQEEACLQELGPLADANSLLPAATVRLGLTPNLTAAHRELLREKLLQLLRRNKPQGERLDWQPVYDRFRDECPLETPEQLFAALREAPQPSPQRRRYLLAALERLAADKDPAALGRLLSDFQGWARENKLLAWQLQADSWQRGEKGFAYEYAKAQLIAASEKGQLETEYLRQAQLWFEQRGLFASAAASPPPGPAVVISYDQQPSVGKAPAYPPLLTEFFCLWLPQPRLNAAQLGELQNWGWLEQKEKLAEKLRQMLAALQPQPGCLAAELTELGAVAELCRANDLAWPQPFWSQLERFLLPDLFAEAAALSRWDELYRRCSGWWGRNEGLETKREKLRWQRIEACYSDPAALSAQLSPAELTGLRDNQAQAIVDGCAKELRTESQFFALLTLIQRLEQHRQPLKLGLDKTARTALLNSPAIAAPTPAAPALSGAATETAAEPREPLSGKKPAWIAVAPAAAKRLEPWVMLAFGLLIGAAATAALLLLTGLGG